MKKLLIFFATILILIVIIYFRFPKEKKSASVKPEDIKIIDIEDKNTARADASLKVLSVNLIGEFEQATAPTQSPTNTPTPTASSEGSASATVKQQESNFQGVATLTPTSPPPKLKSLRLLGEIQNTGVKAVSGATPLVTFYDATNYKLATKVAAFSDNYFFPKLLPQEKYLFDITVKDLPENFTNLSLSFSPATPATPATPFSTILKLQNRNVEEKSAMSQTNQEVFYYVVHGQMINTGDKPVKNARVVAYAKDNSGRVFAWNIQEFPSDLFSPQQTQNISLNLMPVKEGRLEQLEVFFFGEEL